MKGKQSALTLTQTRELLEKLGHEPTKKLGQNFLVEPNIIAKALQFADLHPGEKVCEVGPGLGTLSRSLLAEGVELYAVEKDPRLFKFLTEELVPQHSGKFHVLHADALDAPIAAIETLNGEPYKIVANLPYAISTPWLDAVLEQAQLPDSMTLMLQKETADRFCAHVGTKHWGAISIFLSATYERGGQHTVSGRCFFPPPDVDSALLYLKKKKDGFLFKPQTKRAIRNLFTQRRKQIGGLAKKMLAPEIAGPWLEKLEAEGIPANARPEQIALTGWQLLDALY